MDNLSHLKKAAQYPQLSFLSPSKINLFFRVLSKREDGFHEIASLYQAVSLYDTLTFSLAQEDTLTCSDETLPMDSTNLVVKALSLFREVTGYVHPVKVHLEKKIPIQAGLGGGSSNAATTLFALSEISGLKLSQKELISLGGKIGSDVAFFFSTGSSYCTGKGEKLEDVPPFFLPDLWIAKPQNGLSTPAVYKLCRPSFFTQRDPKESLASFYTEDPDFYNDLEQPAFELDSSLKEIQKDLLEIGFRKVVLCGSGTAFFCIGLKNPKSLPNLSFFPVRPIQKKEQEWYK